jgi:hypothetical protein
MNYLSNFISRPFANHNQDEDSDTMTGPEASRSSPPPSSMSSSSQIPGLDLLSAAQFDAQVAARRAASSPITPASKRPKLATPASSSSSTAPRTLLPSKPHGDSAAKVNDMCQIRHLRADYDFEEGPPYAFSAILRLLDGDQAIQTFEAPGTYGSKKAAKEKAAEMAVTWLENQPIPKKAQKDAGLLPLAAAKVDPSENWVGVLHGRSSAFSRVRCCHVWPYNSTAVPYVAHGQFPGMPLTACISASSTKPQYHMYEDVPVRALLVSTTSIPFTACMSADGSRRSTRALACRLINMSLEPCHAQREAHLYCLSMIILRSGPTYTLQKVN